jgi:hypothetical protein
MPERLFSLKPDDTILATETDLLFTQSEATEILNKLNSLQPGEIFGLNMQSFFVASYITMGKRLRKGGAKWGDGSFYHKIFSILFYELQYIQMLQNYINAGWHYEWLRPPQYYEMRIQQTLKDGTEASLREAIRLVNENPLDLINRLKSLQHLSHLDITNLPMQNHPIHIQSHPNFQTYKRNT